MQQLTNFGTFEIPASANGLASFIVPSTPPKEYISGMFAYEASQGKPIDIDEESDSEGSDEVTHENFFGENANRLKGLFGK